jgi:hypothetical protein
VGQTSEFVRAVAGEETVRSGHDVPICPSCHRAAWPHPGPCLCFSVLIGPVEAVAGSAFHRRARVGHPCAVTGRNSTPLPTAVEAIMRAIRRRAAWHGPSREQGPQPRALEGPGLDEKRKNKTTKSQSARTDGGLIPEAPPRG